MKFHNRLLWIVAMGFPLVVDAGSVCAAAEPATQPVIQLAEAWSKLVPEKWPQLVLTNEASFDAHTALNGASAFLIKMPDASIVVGTAKHLIKELGGVNPPIPLPDLDRVVRAWTLFPRTKVNLNIRAKGIAETSNHEGTHDWLLLHLVDPHAVLPSTPLTPRMRQVAIGETIYLVGVPYTDRESAQNVYKGTVISRPYPTYFKYAFSPPVQISGFSGAPIVDSDGLLIGHGVSRFELKKENGNEVEFGGEDATVAVELWNHRNDPLPVNPAEAIHMTVPEGWVERKSTDPKVILKARVNTAPVFLELFGFAKANYSDGVDLPAFANLVKTNLDKNTAVQNRQDTGIKSFKMGDRSIVEFDSTGTTQQTAVHYRRVMFELNGCFCELVFWCGDADWDSEQSKFDDLAKNVR